LFFPYEQVFMSLDYVGMDSCHSHQGLAHNLMSNVLGTILLRRNVFAMLQGKEVLTREILDERQSRAESWHKEGASKARTLGPAQPITCATYAQDVIEGRAAIDQGHKHSHGAPFLFGPASVVSGSLSTERERLVAQVFQPSHRFVSDWTINCMLV
jgi:hypothetical protein